MYEGEGVGIFSFNVIELLASRNLFVSTSFSLALAECF